jgi:hypothetical protein
MTLADDPLHDRIPLVTDGQVPTVGGVSKRGARAPKAMGHENTRRGRCGLCGQVRPLTKTHVPPQCAGNRGRVKRFTIVSDDEHRAAATSRRIGGVHFFGLCSTCNGVIQGQWDRHYGELAKALWPFAVGTSLTLPGGNLAMSDMEIRPGAVARCVMAGAFALNPKLQDVHPALATELLTGTSTITMPAPLRLLMAITTGPFARVTGSIGGWYMFRPKVGGKNLGIMSLAQIYFPPLAWQIADLDESILLQKERWQDVSDWLEMQPDASVSLSSLVPKLPTVTHPAQRPGGREDWVELLGDEACFIVESDNAIPSNWTDL